MAVDLVCLGGACTDILLRLPRLPERDEKMVVEFAGRVGGGWMANTACAAARLGLRVRWAGLLGDDEGGRLIREEFAAFGVDASAAEVRTGAATDFTVILLDPSGERTILVVPVLPSPPPLTDSLRAALAETRLVYAPPHSPAWFEPMAAAVHRGGGLVAVDVEGELYVIPIAAPVAKTVEQVSVEIRQNVQRLRDGDPEARRIRPALMTVTNLGVCNVENFIPIINPPEPAILGIGKVAPIPVARDDGWIGVEHRCALTLCVDHRVSSGKYAGSFLEAIVKELEAV